MSEDLYPRLTELGITADKREYLAYHYAISKYYELIGSDVRNEHDRVCAFVLAILTDERTGIIPADADGEVTHG